MEYNKLENIKKYVKEFGQVENRKEFERKLCEANNPEFGSIVVYYDLNNLEICCEAMTQGTIVPNSVYLKILPQSLDFEEMDEEELIHIVDILVEELRDVENWIFYDENGEKTIL